MKTKRPVGRPRKDATVTPKEISEVNGTPPPDVQDSIRDAEDKIFLQIHTVEGKPDPSRMRETTKEKLRELYNNAEVLKAIGVVKKKESGGDGDLTIGSDEANALLDVIQMVKVPGATAIYKCSPAIAAQAFTDSELQRSKMTPHLAKVLNKWSPLILKTWKDEIGLAVVMLSVVNAQIRTMHILIDSQKAAPPPPRVQPAPMPSPSPKKVTPTPPEPEAPPKPETAPAKKEVATGDVNLENVGFEI